MKNQKFFLLDALVHAEFRTTESKVAASSEEVAGGSGTTKEATDWQMISEHESTPGQEFNYNERVLDGPGEVRSKPINAEEPDSAIVILTLPKPGAGPSFKMSITLSNNEVSDTVNLEVVTDNFTTLHDNYVKSDIVHEESGKFFTIFDAGSKKYVTYTNNNTENEVIRSECTLIDTYDLFRVSFLVAS